MKKLFTTAILALTIAASTFASDVTVNSTAVRNFSYEFTDAKNVNWKSVANYSRASFTLNEVSMVAYYDREGNYVGSSSKTDLTGLPLPAKRTLAKKYADYTINEAIKFNAPEEDVYYIAATNETHSLILKVSDKGSVSVFKMSKK